MGRIGSPYRPPAKASEDTGLATGENIQDLARVMETEAGGEFESSQIAVGWTLKNRMIRNGVQTVKQAWEGYQHYKKETLEMKYLAKGVLDGSIPDPTDGATHFYTPRIMPKEGDKTHGVDVAGGLESVPGVVGRNGRAIRNYRPGWTREFIRKPVPSVPESVFMFYRQPLGHAR